MTSNPIPHLSRRRFLRAAAMAGAGLLAACAAGEIAQEPAAYRTVTPFRVLPSPQGGEAAQTETPEAAGDAGAVETIRLEDFLAFSSLLTGVDNLDPQLGQVYLDALQSGDGGEGGPTVAEAYSLAVSGSGGLPQDADVLGEAGFFDQEGMGELADSIINMWYSGVYTRDGEEVVATFVDSLAWKVLTFTKPLTICAQFGFWSEEPRADISPSIEYTPVPTEPGEGG